MFNHIYICMKTQLTAFLPSFKKNNSDIQYIRSFTFLCSCFFFSSILPVIVVKLVFPKLEWLCLIFHLKNIE